MRAIYRIVNKETGEEYIGCSSEVDKRWKQHEYELNLGIHHCEELQDAWLHSEADIVFETLEITDKSELYLLLREGELIRERQPAYNKIKKSIYQHEPINYEGEFNINRAQRELIIKALRRSTSIEEASKLNQVSHRHLYRLIQAHKIKAEEVFCK